MLGIGEILFLVALGVLFFGFKKFPELGASLGKTVRMLKQGLSGKDDDRPVRDVKELKKDDDE